ncbi:unnamed protein product [Penicillium salamii]|uniref:Leucine-rich repeat domain-containing protein n=1 Tax=Penicillium salamii TaxID=1612424 RepID=A0A9W4I5G4_9EURO|nr:unnamed protein product [Penicillium salamii]CAG8222552.1 unnamed protein product [Penicillium salamii]CAG8242937.1 unnamed protein product [Penicillium salamii]CAG8311631.1 unnamed protein product [Penicillium salamii]CAG8314598.1 unnamed protein product [Penicillium salamii]
MAALPNDVLLLIGEELQRKTDRWSLIFVSRHFHDLFLPLVYRKVSLQSWRDAASFFYAVVKQPTLARAVRELDFTKWHAEGVREYEHDNITNCTLLTQWVSSVSHSQAESDRWIQCLAQGSSDAWIATILPLLTQLRRLHLVYSTSSPHLDRMMQRVVSGEPPFTVPTFRHLDLVSLHHREDLDQGDSSENQEPSSSQLLLPFFQLPSVRVITANSVVDKPPSLDPDNLSGTDSPKAGFSSVTEIDLRASSGNHGMEMLIASCAELKSFKYQHSDAHVLSHGYRPSAFHRSLSSSKKTLQTLWLDHYGSHYPFTAAGLNQSHDEWFGSLADFTALREVRVRLTNLLDIRLLDEPVIPLVDCLPSSLETLYIEGCEERYFGMLVSQLQTVIKTRDRFPKLQRIEIEGAFHNASDENSHSSGAVLESAIKNKVFQAAEPLHIDCVNAGMELRIHDRALSYF